MTKDSPNRGTPPFNDYITPAILLFIGFLCLINSITVLGPNILLNESRAMAALAFFACAILSRIYTHFRQLLWFQGAQAALDAIAQRRKAIRIAQEARARARDRKAYEQFLQKEQEIKEERQRIQDKIQQEKLRLAQEEALKKARAAQALLQDDTLTPEDEEKLQNDPHPAP